MTGWRKTASASRRVTAGVAQTRPLGRRAARKERKSRDSAGMTASAKILRADRGPTVPKKQWQDDAWSQYRAQGEAWYAVEWLSNALSRVRLKAGRVVDGGDEPEIV